jgi:1-acyl-sn-glycerol-3-phosphate acyltransferase
MTDRLNTLFYWMNVRSWASLIMLIAAKLHLQGKENIPRHGPLIFVSNHLNNADPLALTVMSPRRLIWMVKQEWFSTPVVGWLFHFFGLIPVRRFEADLGALRKAQNALQKGGVLAIFPEGTRSKTGAIAQAEPGAAMIALRTGVPVLPVAIWGTENVKLPRDFFRRTHIYMSIGEPFQLPEARRVDKKAAESGTHEIMDRVAGLLPEKYRGVYGHSAQHTPATAAAD